MGRHLWWRWLPVAASPPECPAVRAGWRREASEGWGVPNHSGRRLQWQWLPEAASPPEYLAVRVGSHREVSEGWATPIRPERRPSVPPG